MLSKLNSQEIIKSHISYIKIELEKNSFVYRIVVIKMQTRSIGVSGIGVKRKRDIDTIIKDIKKEFGDRFIIEVERDIIHVTGDLHNYRIRNQLHEIITGERIGG